MIDKIDRHDIVEKIEYLIKTLPQDQNFCLALNGTWGSGKSVVLELLKEKLLKHPEYIVVHYDAWKNSFYSDPLIAMLYCILDTLENGVPEEISDTITSKRAKHTALVVATKVGESAAEAIAERSLIANFIINAIQKVKNVIKTYKATALTNNPRVENYKSYVSFLNETIKQLNEITSQIILENRQTKLVILVDEIDRCLPNEQLIVLERLHHLFDMHNCAVIVALNKEAIHKNFEKNYGGNSEDYLRKFFQYNFELPTNAEMLLKNRLIDLFNEINNKRYRAINDNDVNFIIEDIVSVTSELLNTRKIDNRDIERFICDSSCILKSIVNYHFALIWFTLRLLLYRKFNDNMYHSIVDEKILPSVMITELEPFYGLKNSKASFSDWQIPHNGRIDKIRYYYYKDERYNDLLYLFNVCRYRNNETLANAFVATIYNKTFKKYNEIPQNLVKQIETVLFEMERYGNM